MKGAIGARELAAAKEPVRIIDIRKNPDDRQIPGSVRMDPASLEDASTVPFGTSDEVVLYCGSGNSCSRIAQTLRERGYNALALDGGYRGWIDAGLPTVSRDDGEDVP